LRYTSKSLGFVWLDCDPHSVVTIGLKRILGERAQVHVEWGNPRSEPPNVILLCSDDAEGATEEVKRFKEENPDATILVFSSGLDLPLARAVLRAGARGYIHGGMRPAQLVRAIEVAAEGEIAAPRKLMGYLLAQGENPGVDALSARQREILGFVVEGLSNAEIGRRLHLSESTIKQHLRAAYKVLKVSNRTEAANLVRRYGSDPR
jgi:DNA-binding NarL/FixJ family response regulator